MAVARLLVTYANAIKVHYCISQNIIVNGKNVDTNKKGKNKFYC